MLRRIATVFNLLAMLMVLFTTIVPHHHHQAMVCFAREVCVADGCCNDEHTAHADADPEESESHCVAHEAYCQSDDLRLEGISAFPAPVAAIFCPAPTQVRDLRVPCRTVRCFSPPPLLSWRINC